MLVDQFIKRVGIHFLPTHAEGQEGVFHCRFDDFLLRGAEALPHIVVDHQLTDRVVFVHARRVVILKHLMQAQAQILNTAHPFSTINHTALRSRKDFTARKIDHCHAELGVNIGIQTRLAALQSLEVGNRFDLFFEPTQRLRARGKNRERDHVELHPVQI